MNIVKSKSIVSLLVLAILVNIIFSSSVIQVNAITQDIATWEYAAAATTPEAAATGGSNKDTARLTNSNNQTPGFATGSLKITGWDNGANSKYWQINLSTKGYDNLKLSAKTRSSGTGPAEFKVIYSNDGGTSWKDVSNGAYKMSNTNLNATVNQLQLPDDASNLENLLIRFIMTSNIAVNGTTVGSGGVSNINNISIIGDPVTSTDVVAGIEATPESGSEVKAGQEIALSTKTEGATIKYSINGSEFTDYKEADKPKLKVTTSSAITVEAYGTKTGLKDSIKSIFTYIQAKTAAVTASPNGGSIKKGQKIELACGTEGANIEYCLDGSTWNKYSGSIEINSLPMTILAKAKCEGMIDSEETQFKFTEKTGEYKPYFGQLHSHTTNSDGAGTVEDAFSYASKINGLDFLAVTDHSNSLEDKAGTANIKDGSSSSKWNYGVTTADKFTNNKFVGIYGYEMTWSNGTGHINTFNTAGFENRNTKDYGTSNGLKLYYDKLKTVTNSISQFNHPGTTFGDFNDFANYDPEIDKLITLVEVGNGEGPIRGSGYFPSYEYYTRALDKGWHVSPSNNQDNHKGKWGDANTARTVILADTLSRDNIYDAMRNRRTYATEDNDLKIDYTLNEQEMGTIMSSKPSNVNIKVQAEDPDGEAIGTVQVIVNGGKVAAEKKVTSSKEEVDFNLPAEYSYYYIKIQQPDKDIAVTAPVWIGEVEKAGIAKTSTTTVLPVKGEDINVTTNIYNNETSNMEVTKLEYSIGGNVIHEADLTQIKTIETCINKDYSFIYKPSVSGSCTIDVKLYAKINGVDKIFTDTLKISVSDPKVVTKIVVDGSHYNDYVNGYYAGNMTNFTKICGNITKEILDRASMFVITPPAKKVGSYQGSSWTPEVFSDEFIALVKDYVNKGGNLVICGMADYQDGDGDYQSTTQMNKLLEAIGVTSRLNNDQVVDNTNNGGQAYRLKFKNFNMESPLLKGVIAEQQYSFYSGCSVLLDENSIKNGNTTWLIKGHDTTETSDTKQLSKVPAVPVEKGNVYALASEKLPGGGTMLIGGTVYLSNFEVQAEKDNWSDLQYVNYNIMDNMVDLCKKKVEINTIGDARKGSKGDVFTVEGIVTAGTQSGNAFFDTIYIQDQTGGINIFPINQGDIRVGQKVRVTGSLDEYQGDLELRVTDSNIIDTIINPIEPQVVTTKEASDYASNGGKLVKVQGTVTDVKLENEVISYMKVKDESGIETRVFIDGYIGASNQNSPKLENFVKVGSNISAIGLVSYDPDGSRIRVRDRSEIKNIVSVKVDPIDDITVKRNRTISLPEKINVTYSDGTTNSVPVKWDAVDTSTTGVKVVKGIVEIEGTQIEAKINVIVKKTSSGSSSSGSSNSSSPSSDTSSNDNTQSNNGTTVTDKPANNGDNGINKASNEPTNKPSNNTSSENTTDNVSKKTVKQASTIEEARTLLDNAISASTFYDYNMAYDSIMRLPEGNKMLQVQMENELGQIANKVWTDDIKNINKEIDEMVKTKSAKLYDQIVLEINNSNFVQVDKEYLSNELATWGRELVWTEDYKLAVASLVKAWNEKNDTNINLAKQTIVKVSLESNRDYLNQELNKIIKIMK
jgi:hypothetical protein